METVLMDDIEVDPTTEATIETSPLPSAVMVDLHGRNARNHHDRPVFQSSGTKLADEDELELFDKQKIHSQPSTPPNTSSSSPATNQDNVTRVHISASKRSSKSRTRSQLANGRPALTSVIMMYSPYIHLDEQSSSSTGEASGDSEYPSGRWLELGNYYARIDREETVKCVATSVLFCAVVVAIFLVAILKNPGM